MTGAAFTPHGERFSGHLPALADAPAALERAYVTGAEALAGMVGGGEVAEAALLAPTATTLLEPVGSRAAILARLAETPRGVGDSTAVDRAAVDRALFAVVDAYVGVTGDLDLVGERVGACLRSMSQELGEQPGKRLLGTVGPGLAMRGGWVTERVHEQQDATSPDEFPLKFRHLFVSASRQ